MDCSPCALCKVAMNIKTVTYVAIITIDYIYLRTLGIHNLLCYCSVLYGYFTPYSWFVPISLKFCKGLLLKLILIERCTPRSLMQISDIPYSGFYLRGAISANIQFFSPAVMSAIIKSAKCKSFIHEPTASASLNSASPQRLA